MIRGNAHATVHLRTINQFLKLVYLRTHVNKSQYTFCEINHDPLMIAHQTGVRLLIVNGQHKIVLKTKNIYKLSNCVMVVLLN